jgi:hypothetical protein
MYFFKVQYNKASHSAVKKWSNKGGVFSNEVNEVNSVVFYSLSMHLRYCLIRGIVFDGCGLIQGVVFVGVAWYKGWSLWEWPDKRDCLWWVWPNTRGGLCGSDLIRGIVFDGNGLIQEVRRRIKDFKLGGGGTLKKIAPSRGRCENFWGIPCESGSGLI